MSSGVGGAVTDDHLRVQALRVGLRVSGGVQVRGVTVCAGLLVVGLLAVIGRGEVAGFDHGRHVNWRGRVGS